jgi:arylsulfatase A-like enzyme
MGTGSPFRKIFVNSLGLMASQNHKRLAPSARSILSGREWVYLGSLLVPMVIYNLVLKGIRIRSQDEVIGVFGVLDLMRSDVLFSLGFAFLWVGLFAVTRESRWRWLVVALFHAATIVVVGISTAAHQYFQETGSMLSLTVILYSVKSFGEIKDVIGSVTSPAVWFAVLALVDYMVLGPWMISRVIYGRRRANESSGSSATSRLFAVVTCTVSFGLILLSLPVDTGGVSKSFSRDPVANVVMSEVEHARIRDLTDGARPMPTPVNTHLQATGDTNKKNVVFIHLESTRARSTTPYNKDIDTTPYLDELSRHSLTAENAYTIVPHTSKAITAINCGIDPHLVRDITEAEPNGIPAKCLPELLDEQGYNSVWFSSATEHFEDRRELVDNFGYRDFLPVDDMDKTGFQRSNYFGYEDDIMLQPSKDWLEQHQDKPFIATYLGVTGHHDYRPIYRYGREEYSKDSALNNYQNEVRYLDFFVKNVIDQYKELGLYDDTIFVIYGDHGEGFWEHDLNQHDNTIYQEGLKVPLIIHEPGRFQNEKRVDTLTDQVDIMPTVLDLLGYKVEGGEYPGRSLLAPPDKNRTLFFSCFDDYRCLASIKGDEKYIYFFGNQPDEVYDLSKDPNEHHDIAGELSNAELKKKRSEVLAWYSMVNATYEKGSGK